MSTQDPDRELIERLCNGDRLAFDELVLKYRSRIMGIAARMLGDRAEAEDLAQDVFVKLFHSLKNFNGEALFSTWLYRITANSCSSGNVAVASRNCSRSKVTNSTAEAAMAAALWGRSSSTASPPNV